MSSLQDMCVSVARAPMGLLRCHRLQNCDSYRLQRITPC
jgi:hypothetical protein